MLLGLMQVSKSTIRAPAGRVSRRLTGVGLGWAGSATGVSLGVVGALLVVRSLELGRPLGDVDGAPPALLVQPAISASPSSAVVPGRHARWTCLPGLLQSIG